MDLTKKRPNAYDFLEIQNCLDDIKSEDPFEILFYGSRERGDQEPDSDFNFYLLASTQDQMKPGFIQRINSALNHLETISHVNLVAGDSDTFRIRMNLFEPSVVHMLEKATVFYGEHLFHGYQKEWETIKKNPIPLDKLVPFLNRRIHFYKSLNSRNEKDSAVRNERVYSLSIQVWALKNIPDLSLTELISLDIPIFYERMIPILYSTEVDDTILELMEGRRHWAEKKRALQRNSKSDIHESPRLLALQSTQSR